MKLKKIFALALATSLVLPGVSALADDDFDDYDDYDDLDDDDDDDDDRKTSSRSETIKALRELKVSVEANKIQHAAAKLLLDEFPITVQKVKGKLQKLVRESEEFQKLSAELIKELEDELKSR